MVVPKFEDISRVTSAIKPKVTIEMNECLLRKLTKEEVETTVAQMTPFKSSGLDGFGVVFYQQHWPTVGSDVCDEILSILNKRSMSSSLNSTFITLIPIKCNVEFVMDYRPISYCNVLYKLVSKSITNRLKPMMNSIISCNQSTFLLGRLIMDNIMVAHELLYTLQ